MKIAIGSDHAAFDAKQKIIRLLKSLGHEVDDCGPHTEDPCDYPDFAEKVSCAIRNNKSERGILICGSGIGMSIAANRFSGIRAALCYTEELAVLSRLHNDSNVLCLGARTQSISSMEAIVIPWLTTEWEGDRHALRLKKIETNPGESCA